jgi:hypothetical protein
VKNYLKSILLLLMVSTLQAGEPWTKTEVALETGFQILLLIDWKQTSEFHRHRVPVHYPKTDPYGNTITGPDSYLSPIHENNPFLGAHPSQARINAACLLTSLGHVAISNMLSSGRHRIAWQASTIWIEALVVKGNANLGVHIRW